MLTRLHRHPYLTALTLFFLTTGTALLIFLSTFNLDDYRSELEQTLQSALQRPVRLGALHFTLSRGLGLSVSAAQIGSPGDEIELTVQRLVLRLNIAPLFARHLSFSRILLDQPKILWRPSLAAAPAAAPTSAPLQIQATLNQLRRLRIEALTIRNATITVIDRRAQKERIWGTEQVEVQLHDLALSGPISIEAAGALRVNDSLTPWHLAGVVEPPDADRPWEETQARLTLSVTGLQPENLTPFWSNADQAPVKLEGTCNLTLSCDGAPATGLNFKLRAQGNRFSLAIPEFYLEPLRVKHAMLSGTWLSGAEGQIRDLALRIDDLSLRGEIALPAAANAPRLATLHFPETSLAGLARFFPDRRFPTLAANLRGPDTRGTLEIDQINLSWPQGATPELVDARLRLRNGRLSTTQTGLVEEANLELRWHQRSLEVVSARARLLGGTLEGQGQIGFPLQAVAQLKLKITGEARAEALIPRLPMPWRERLQAAGKTSFTASLGGTLTRLLLDLQVLFNDTALSYNQTVLKAAGQPGELLLLGAATAQNLELSHARLLLPFAEVRATGQLALDGSGRYDLAGDITHLALAAMPIFLPIQRELQPKGEVDLHLEVRGDHTGLSALSGDGDFRNLGLHLWNTVADLRGGSGRLTLSRNGMVFDQLSALLGLSPLRATGELKWLPAFSLNLDLDLPKVRANELIFKSASQSLENVRGRVAIDNHGLAFKELSARIGEGTAVVVNGRLDDYRQPQVMLDIAASRVDVKEVIGLWQNPGKGTNKPTQNPAPDKPGVLVTIAARIAAGDLYGLRFQNGTATIVFRDGRLVIHPLHLQIGQGSATAQVVSSQLTESAPRLKVSGRLEQVDADTVYRQMLKRSGALTGALSGDFYLDGELSNYLPTATGGLSFELEDGTLRGFTALGRVFSLLNLSNLLTLHLPDLTSDGLPYNRLSGTATLKNGFLQTDDLTLDSDAIDLALVGSHDLSKDQLDLILVAKPLRVVDKILSSIPLAGWILTGEEKALITAQFRIQGSARDPQVEAIPISSLSGMVIGIFKRTLGLPEKVIEDVKGLFESEGGGQQAGGATSPPSKP